MVLVMAHLTSSVEYGLHCLLWLVDTEAAPLSAKDLAELQGVSQTFLAKIFQKLERAGVVRAVSGLRGGYQLAKPPAEISFLAVVDAIEGDKPLFDCREIRGRCALFGATPPLWATNGTCAIHAVMLKAEKSMRATLAACSLADIWQALGRKMPKAFAGEVHTWLDARHRARAGPRKSKRPGRPRKAAQR